MAVGVSLAFAGEATLDSLDLGLRLYDVTFLDSVCVCVIGCSKFQSCGPLIRTVFQRLRRVSSTTAAVNRFDVKVVKSTHVYGSVMLSQCYQHQQQPQQ